MSSVAPGKEAVVFSQVRPQGDHAAPGTIPKPVIAFYRGEPEVLGTTQAFAGILFVSLGISMTIVHSPTLGWSNFVFISGILLWSGILFIISGSLSVAGSVKPTLGKVKSSLVMNIFSSLVALCGMLLVALDLFISSIFPTSIFQWWSYCAHYKSDSQCLGDFTPIYVHNIVFAFFLMLFMLVFCITISTSVFACRTVCRSSLHEMSVVIYQTTSLNTSDTSRDVPLDSDLKTQT